MPCLAFDLKILNLYLIHFYIVSMELLANNKSNGLIHLHVDSLEITFPVVLNVTISANKKQTHTYTFAHIFSWSIDSVHIIHTSQFQCSCSPSADILFRFIAEKRCLLSLINSSKFKLHMTN